MIKNLYSRFCTKSQYSFILNYEAVDEELCLCAVCVDRKIRV